MMACVVHFLCDRWYSCHHHTTLRSRQLDYAVRCIAHPIPPHLSSFKSFLTSMPIIHTICHIQCVLFNSVLSHGTPCFTLLCIGHVLLSPPSISTPTHHIHVHLSPCPTPTPTRKHYVRHFHPNVRTYSNTLQPTSSVLVRREDSREGDDVLALDSLNAMPGGMLQVSAQVALKECRIMCVFCSVLSG